MEMRRKKQEREREEKIKSGSETAGSEGLRRKNVEGRMQNGGNGW